MAQATRNRPHTPQPSHSSGEDWRTIAADRVERVQHTVQDHAASSMLIALVSGLGIGILIGTALGGSRRSTRWWDRSTAEGLGSRLLEKVEGVIPDAISERFHR